MLIKIFEVAFLIFSVTISSNSISVISNKKICNWNERANIIEKFKQGSLENQHTLASYSACYQLETEVFK